MLKKRDYTETNDKLRMLLETEATIEGNASKFVQRESKMTASSFAETLILGSLSKPDNTLVELVQISADVNVSISPSGLNQRMNEKSVAFMKRMLGKSIQICQSKEETEATRELLKTFTAVQILDSSYLRLPKGMCEQYPGLGGGEAAGMKVFLNYEYIQGEITALEITAGRQADQTSRLHIESAQADSLHLFDLGFFKQEVFTELDKQKAYYISRLQTQTALYWPTGEQERVNLAEYLLNEKGNQVNLDLLLGAKVRQPIRLLCQRLPKSVVAERRRKAKLKAKKDGRRQPPTPTTLSLLDWAIFITNVPQAQLSVAQVVLIYRLRWQIELLFKLWKSRAYLDQIGSLRRQRLLCQLYARLAALVLFHWIVAPTYFLHKELSLPKAFSLLRHHMVSLIQAIGNHWQGLAMIWGRIEEDFQRLGMKDKRKKSPSTYQLLLEAGL